MIVPRWMGDSSGDENELKSSLFSSNYLNPANSDICSGFLSEKVGRNVGIRLIPTFAPVFEAKMLEEKWNEYLCRTNGLLAPVKPG